MRKINSLLIIILFVTVKSFGQTNNAFDLARVSKINNKLVFLFSEPLNEYETAFTFENSIQNYDCLNPQELVIESIKNANKEAADQGKPYDAIILVDGSLRDLAITWNDKSKDNAIARVRKNEGKLVFVQCEPLTNYDVVGKYDISGLGQQILLGSCPSQQEKIDKLIKKSIRDEIEFDAVMYGSSKYDFSIKFK